MTCWRSTTEVTCEQPVSSFFPTWTVMFPSWSTPQLVMRSDLRSFFISLKAWLSSRQLKIQDDIDLLVKAVACLVVLPSKHACFRISG